LYAEHHDGQPCVHFFFLIAVFAAFLKASAVGAPGAPGLRIFSFEPSAMRLRLAWMLA
jgi:hypothetical protein